MSNAFLLRMPGGIPGDVTRKEQADIRPEILNTSYPVEYFGVPVKIVSGKALPIASGDTIASVYFGGFSVRPYPGMSQTSEAMGTATPSTIQPLDCLKKGYMTVKCNAMTLGVPAKGGVVYIRKTDHGASEYPIGGVEATADGGKCEALPYVFFTGTGDADGNAEINITVTAK